MRGQEPLRDDSILRRASRIAIPWIALIIVVLMMWTFVSDYRRDVRTSETTSTAEATAVAGIQDGEAYVEILTDGLNLRSEPSTSAGVVAVLTGGAKTALIEEGAGWYHVRTADGAEGWVAAGGSYTKLVQP